MTSSVRFSSQISNLVKRSDFDLDQSRHGIEAALHPSDRLVHVLDLPEQEAGDQLASLGESPVDDGTAGTGERIVWRRYRPNCVAESRKNNVIRLLFLLRFGRKW